MAMVRLGKMPLRWCTSCDLPILEAKGCGTCGARTQRVTVTPPGDIRPAFHYDLEMIRERIDLQFGEGAGLEVLPRGIVALLNRCPALDRMDEVIVKGHVIGAYLFDIEALDFKFVPRMYVANHIVASGSLKKGWIKVDTGAYEAIADGANALAPGVMDADVDIVPGDEVVILTLEGEALAVGPARMYGTEMLEKQRGVAVKARWYKRSKGSHHSEAPKESKVPRRRTWELVLKANRPFLEEKVHASIDFIKRTKKRYGLPVAVSYSGGKDSLATLLLALEAGLRPKVIFVDTGLELKDTVENVHMVCRSHDLELIEERAGNAFWDALPSFGPPGRDFRWCCKTCKLGPVSKLIKRNFPKGVLTLIGQRSYESMQRHGKGAIWRNPWVGSQVGASPIQEWSALQVWLYLFDKSAEVNPLYTAGQARIGCWLCPASDIGDLRLLAPFIDDDRWKRFLDGFSKDRGLSQGWTRRALWRWKNLPKGMKRYLGDTLATKAPKVKDGHLRLVLAQGYRPCIGGVSTEGAYDRPLDMARVRSFLCTVGQVEDLEEGNGAVSVEGWCDIFAEGAIVVRGKDEGEVTKRVTTIGRAILRAQECVGCGVCLGRCEFDAIEIRGKKAVVSVEKCTSCGECSKRCPVADFPLMDDESTADRLHG